MFGFLNKTQVRYVDPQVQDEFVQKVSAAADAFLLAIEPAERAAYDFSPGSVIRLDAAAARVRDGALELTPLQRVGMAAYLYEVARRHQGGIYEVCDDDDPVVLVTGDPQCEICLCAISRVERNLAGAQPEPLSDLYARYVDAVQADRPELVR